MIASLASGLGPPGEAVYHRIYSAVVNKGLHLAHWMPRSWCGIRVVATRPWASSTSASTSTSLAKRCTGRRREIQAEGELKALYRDWVAQITDKDKPFAWGAIENCLERQILALPPEQAADLCVALAERDSQRAQEIVTTALDTCGRGQAGPRRGGHQTYAAAGCSRLGALVRRETESKQCPPAKRIAVDIAARFGCSDVLKMALTDPSGAVRAVAMRHAYIYWSEDTRPRALQFTAGNARETTGSFGCSIFRSESGSSLPWALLLLILFDDFSNYGNPSRPFAVFGGRTISRGSSG